MFQRPRLLLISGSVLLLLAGILVATGVWRGKKATPPAPCGLQACRANQLPVPLRGFEGAYVAADPRMPRHVVVAAADLLNNQCGFHTTFDGGKGWIDGAFTLPAGFTGCRINNPSGGHVASGSVVIGSYGQVYSVFGSAREGDGRRESVLVATSIDGGRSFLPARVAASPPPPDVGLARPLMTVGRGSSGKDALLLSFWGCHPTGTGTACDKAYFAQSADAGTTFTSPVLVNQPPFGQNPSQPAVGTDGTIYETFQRRFTDHVDLLLAKSTDNGTTFTESPIDTENQLGIQYDPAKLVVDPRTGALYTVWSDTRMGRPQIFFRKSSDKGATWTQALLLGTDPTATGASRTPSISVAPDGRIDVVFYHTTPEQPTLDDVYLKFSNDGGVTWPVRKVNDKPVDRTIGYSGPINSMGLVGNWYPPTISSLDTEAYVVWSDSINATPLTQTQDVMMRTLTFAAAAGP